MRLMSFALTTEQVRQQTKTVTRRLGWASLKPGTLLQPVVKGMGLRKGEHPEKIGGPIRVVSVRREWLYEIEQQPEDCAREGFPDLTPSGFLQMFCRHNGCGDGERVTRIEFAYTEPRTGSTSTRTPGRRSTRTWRRWRPPRS
jgi:hypothetical protein